MKVQDYQKYLQSSLDVTTFDQIHKGKKSEFSFVDQILSS